ncbi:MAG TPA: hypothetical protein VEI57_12045 [Nitrospirota bacterium]|nr:hypothetical protein [Nitrospirota bacterium]
MTDFLTHRSVAELSLTGMGLDVLGGCYLAYDLLGGKRGPLRTIAQATGYIALFFVGYNIVVGLRYAIVAASGMGILLAIEFRRAAINPARHRERRATVLLFAFLRGFVLGLAGISIAGLSFGVVFGMLSGMGLSISYALGFAPTHDYEAKSEPHLSWHKVFASLWRAAVVSVAGIVAGVLTSAETHWILFGLKLGLAAGTVSAMVSLFSPTIEWWIENLPERRLGVIGVGLILVGVLFQSVQYWFVVLDVPVH